jgi:beta-N-acetylhexosaminidase
MATLSEQVRQLFWIGFEGDAWHPDLDELLSEARPGGVIFFSRNLATPQQFAELIRKVTACLAEPPLPPPLLAPLLAIDLEGGKVDRLRDVLAPLPSARDAARAGLARELGRIAGREVAAFGLNVDFAPVLDLGLPESESVLGTRTANASPEQVARFGEEFLAGLAESSVLGCGKHFPGLGSGCLDSHLVMPQIEKDADSLWEQDLFPYRKLAARLPMVMVAHAAYPSLHPGSSKIDSKQLLPASLSRNIVSGLLKGRIGYKGLVLSDDLEMEGALEGRTIGEAAVTAVRAGCDMLLVCRHAANVRAAFEAVLREAEHDPDFRTVAEAAAQKVLRTRQRLQPALLAESTRSDWEGLRGEIRELTAEVQRRLGGNPEKGSDA